MRKAVLLLKLLAIGSLYSSASAVDLTEIERTVRQEPTYSTQPRYALLVMGPNADTRIWLVVDGETLYVDRNRNGKLTDPGEQVVGVSPEDSDVLEFRAGELVEADGETVHSDLIVYRYLHPTRGRWVYGVIVKDVLGLAGQGISGEDGCSFAESPAKAPVLHMNGPLTMRVQGAVVGNSRKSRVTSFPFALEQGERVKHLYVQVGTPGIGHDTFAALAVESGFPADVHPRVQLTVPSKTDSDKTIELDFWLRERC